MEFLTFHVGDREFAVDLGRVREIVNPPPITRVPEMPPAVLGLAGLRGEPTAVIDAGVRLAGYPIEITGRTPLLVLGVQEHDRAVSIGLIVEAAGRKLEVDALMPWSDALARFAGSDACVGFAEVPGGMVLVLDVDRLLSFDRLAAAVRAARAVRATASHSTASSSSVSVETAAPAFAAAAAGAPALNPTAPFAAAPVAVSVQAPVARIEPVTDPQPPAPSLAARESGALRAVSPEAARYMPTDTPPPSKPFRPLPPVRAVPTPPATVRPANPPHPHLDREGVYPLPAVPRPAAIAPPDAATHSLAAASDPTPVEPFPRPEPARQRSRAAWWGAGIAATLLLIGALLLSSLTDSGEALRVAAERTRPYVAPTLSDPPAAPVQPAPSAPSVAVAPPVAPTEPPPVAATAPAPATPPPAPTPARTARPLPASMVVTPETPACEIHEVVKGDTLWHISAQKLGSPYRWPTLFGENRDRILDPDVIEVHDRIRIPGACTPPPTR